ncbi:MAG: amidohydrolase, partial [Elioraea sp.]|nr:amidohydrolase [Elioraea sp.]
ELVISGGPIWCGKGEGFVDAVAVADGRIIAAGTVADLEAVLRPGTRRLDLYGRLAVPGLVEAHMHLLPYGLGLAQVNLRPDDGVGTLDELLRRLAAATARARPGAWILGRGYDHGALDIARHPTAADLDRAVPHHPVVIKRACGHMLVANSAALHLAGLTADTPDPEGGAIGREGGTLNGLFQERAMRLMLDHVPPPDETAMVEAIGAACRDLARFGFTAASDMNVGSTAGLAEIDAYRRAEREGALSLRLWQVLAGNPEGIADAAWDCGLRPMSGGPLLRWGGVKVFADGSAGGLTAAFSEPYLASAGGGRGLLCFSTETLHALLGHYHRRGWQLAIHAIGDAAIEQVLSGMEAADSPEHPVAGRRHRIEHCGFVTEGQRRRMLARGVIPVPQPVFIHEFGDLYVANLGRARAEASYPMRSWIDEGADPPASSDAPVSTVNPFVNLHAMLTRRTCRGTVVGEDQRITLAEALHAYTRAGAFTQFAETERGTLAPGMRADIAVVDRNLFACDPEEILAARVDLTLRDGKVLFDRHGEIAAAAA